MPKATKRNPETEAAARDWPADAVERRSVKSLMAYPRNARIHSKDQIAQIVSSMKEFGWTIPILVDDKGVVIAGHGRLAAANKLGYSEVPVMIARGWSEQQKAAYRIADNQLTLNSEWDAGLLKIELNELRLADYPLELTGFADVQLVSFLSGVNDPNAEWTGMPEFEQQNKQAFRTLPIHFKDQEAVDKFAKAIKQKITDDTRFVWFPEIEIETYADKLYRGSK